MRSPAGIVSRADSAACRAATDLAAKPQAFSGGLKYELQLFDKSLLRNRVGLPNVVDRSVDPTYRTRVLLNFL